jgi:hypothetical protein
MIFGRAVGHIRSSGRIRLGLFWFLSFLCTGSFFWFRVIFHTNLVFVLFPSSLPACVLGHSICIIKDMVMELSYHDVR